uniref:Nephronectin a n=1 Tax=Xiphophorus couchianus TaxID=32473 RepID=A0A3B5MCE9_9TELE
ADRNLWTDQAVLSDGLCRYGNGVECCWGWRRTERDRCQREDRQNSDRKFRMFQTDCQQGCKHGDCVEPDKCKCHPGYTGKTCNQDLNECGVKPRPCKHRCMNTAGSFKCFCLDGFALQPDGSCRNVRTCFHANCQYGCEVMKGEVRCTCPSPGLRLGPDRRSCVDVDECALGAACPRRRKCVNTFGSFFCKCQLGFKLTFIDGRYACIGEEQRVSHLKPQTVISSSDRATRSRDKTAVSTTSMATSTVAMTTGSQTTQLATTVPTAPPTVPATSATTAAEPPVAIATTTLPSTTSAVVTTTLNNRINKDVTQRQRGDVHSEAACSVAAAGDLRCSFSRGVCAWISERDGDLSWEVVEAPTGGRYLSVPELKEGQRGVRGARLAVQILPLWNHGDACFSFSHWLTGRQVGVLQLFVRKKGRDQRYGSALWSRTGGHGWRQTQVTLETESVDKVLLKAERRPGRRGQMAVDDVTLRRGSCR